jgi:serine/threonine protein phosphatase PrpC
MEYVTALDVGERKRRHDGINEDSVAVTLVEEGHRDTERTSGVFVVADGAGGTQAGDVASYVATVEVSRRLTDRLWRERLLTEAADALGTDGRNGHALELTDGVVADPLADAGDEAVQALIERAIQDAHTRIVRVTGDLDVDSAYTTVVVAVVAGGRLHYGWVGDSRAYLVNAAREEICRLTRDHAVVERLHESGQIDDVEAMVHPRGNEITRALGGTGGEDPDTATVEVETRTVPVYAEDVVLVTSDGLVDAQTEAARLYEWYVDADRDDETAAVVRDRAVTDDEIRDSVLSAPSMESAAADLVALANDRGGKDNLSTLLLRDGTLPETPDDPPTRSIDAVSVVEDRQTLLND